jgi:uncharacterized damage-inducible protein DinB
VTDWKPLFAYDDWANREVLSSLTAAGSRPEKSRKLLGHIVGAERLWIARIESQPPPPPEVWPDLALADCRTAIEELESGWQRLVGALSEDELARAVVYTNSKGERWTNEVADILMHVVMHSVHHRGQIAADMRASGLEPPYVDYIHAVRQGKLGGRT